VVVPLECDGVCAFLGEACAEFTDGCERCTRVNEKGVPRLSERTSALCLAAISAETCVGLRACLADKHGIFAGSQGTTVTVDGADFEIAPMEESWAIVGAKSDGSPSDLEIYTTAMDQSIRIKFDDIIVGGLGVLDAQQHPVEIEVGSSDTKFELGTVAVIRLTLEGEDAGYQIDARVQETAGGPEIRIQANGPL